MSVSFHASGPGPKVLPPTRSPVVESVKPSDTTPQAVQTGESAPTFTENESSVPSTTSVKSTSLTVPTTTLTSSAAQNSVLTSAVSTTPAPSTTSRTSISGSSSTFNSSSISPTVATPQSSTNTHSSSSADTPTPVSALSSGTRGVGGTTIHTQVVTKPFVKQTAAAASLFTVVALLAFGIVIVIYLRLFRHRRLTFAKIDKAAQGRRHGIWGHITTLFTTSPTTGNAANSTASQQTNAEQGLEAPSSDAHPEGRIQWQMESPEPPPSYSSQVTSYAGSEVDVRTSEIAISEALATAALSTPGNDTPVEKTLRH